jgi:hypothetical protein
MNNSLNLIDSKNIKTLAEFKYAGELVENKAVFRVGSYNSGLLVVSSQSIFAKDKSKYIVPSDFNEQQRQVYQKSIDRDFWSADIFFNRLNLEKIIERIEVCLGIKEPEDAIDINAFEINGYEDKIAVRINNISPLNKPEPIITLQLLNLRRASLDLLESESQELWVSLETGEVLLKELKKIQNSVNIEA